MADHAPTASAKADMESESSESDKKLAAVHSAALHPIISIDTSGRIMSSNAACEAVLGYPPEELDGAHLSILLPAPYAAEHDRYIERYLETGEARIVGIGREVFARHKSGRLIPVNLAVSEHEFRGRRYFTGILHDLSERRRLERSLVQAASREQARIGQELHDTVGQDLVGLSLLLKSYVESCSETDPAAMGPGQALLDRLKTVTRNVRAAGIMLSPLQEMGFTTALDHLGATIESNFRVPCEVTCAADPPDEAVANELYRIAREAATNAARHAGAKQIRIRHDRGRLSITDDGCGFTPSESRTASGMGLSLMRFRARSIHWELSWRRQQPGTEVLCVDPLSRLSTVDPLR